MAKFTVNNKGILIEFYVKPNSKKSKLVIEEEALILHIKAPPVKGKANKAIIQFLSNYFGVSKSQISFISGLKSKTKSFLFEDLNKEQEARMHHLVFE